MKLFQMEQRAVPKLRLSTRKCSRRSSMSCSQSSWRATSSARFTWFLENDPLPSSARECGLCLSWLFLQAILIASMALYKINKWSSSGSGILCCATQCYAPAEQPTAGWKWAGPLGSGLKRPPGRTLLDLHFILMVRLLLPGGYM